MVQKTRINFMFFRAKAKTNNDVFFPLKETHDLFLKTSVITLF